MRAILDTPTWRASADWGARLGYDSDALADVNRRAVQLLASIREQNPDVTIAISGSIGPRGDGYVVGETMTAAEAEAYHAPQVRALDGSDLLTALTLTYPAEAVGVVRAAAAAAKPAHPTHFEHVLPVDRLRGVRANASKLSHAELDVAEELDEGDPEELGRDYARLARLQPTLDVVGGCCGTDDRHVAAVAAAISDP